MRCEGQKPLRYRCPWAMIPPHPVQVLLKIRSVRPPATIRVLATPLGRGEDTPDKTIHS